MRIKGFNSLSERVLFAWKIGASVVSEFGLIFIKMSTTESQILNSYERSPSSVISEGDRTMEVSSSSQGVVWLLVCTLSLVYPCQSKHTYSSSDEEEISIHCSAMGVYILFHFVMTDLV